MENNYGFDSESGYGRENESDCEIFYAPTVAVPKRRRSRGLTKIFAACLSVAVVGAASFGVGLGVGSRPAAEPPAAVKSDVSQKSEGKINGDWLSDVVGDAPAVVEVTPAPRAIEEDYKGVTYSDVFSAGTSLITDVYKVVSPSVVSINVKAVTSGMFNMQYESTSKGSGIIFNQDDEKVYIVTNYHVINGAREVAVSLDDAVAITANYVGGNESNDIAVISVSRGELEEKNPGGYSVARFADSDKLEVGGFAVAIGNAMGEGKSATFGIISAVNKQITTDSSQILSVIQTDAAINPGNSGGALVNDQGFVIGINTIKLASVGVEGMGYAIPSNTVSAIAEGIMNSGDIRSPYLGVETYTITEEVREAYNFPSVGLYINGVYQNSGAAEAGLRRGDIITAINGVSVETIESFSGFITSSKVGDTLKLTVIRGGQTLEISATLKNKGFDF
jgi:serine protease Do